MIDEIHHLIVADYLREKVQRDVEDLLDDPHGAFEGMSADHIALHMLKLNHVAAAVGLSLPSLIRSTGTEFERDRLMGILAEVDESSP